MTQAKRIARCKNCEHWGGRTFRMNAIQGYCYVFDKPTMPDDGVQCTAFLANAPCAHFDASDYENTLCANCGHLQREHVARTVSGGKLPKEL
jgi:hypothetical protein